MPYKGTRKKPGPKVVKPEADPLVRRRGGPGRRRTKPIIKRRPKPPPLTSKERNHAFRLRKLEELELIREMRAKGATDEEVNEFVRQRRFETHKKRFHRWSLPITSDQEDEGQLDCNGGKVTSEPLNIVVPCEEKRLYETLTIEILNEIPEISNEGSLREDALPELTSADLANSIISDHNSETANENPTEKDALPELTSADLAGSIDSDHNSETANESSTKEDALPELTSVDLASSIVSDHNSEQLSDSLKCESVDIEEDALWTSDSESVSDLSKPASPLVEVMKEQDELHFTVKINFKKKHEMLPTIDDKVDKLSARDAEETAGLPRCKCCGEIELYSNHVPHHTSIDLNNSPSEKESDDDKNKTPEPDVLLKSDGPKNEAKNISSAPKRVRKKYKKPSSWQIEDLPCPKCPKRFRKKAGYDAHVAKHDGKKIIPCRKEGCKAMFWDFEGRRSHEIRCGRTVQQQCNICGKVTRSMNALKTHLHEVHEATPFLCDVCGVGFHYRHNMEDHRRSMHTDVRFQCDICKKSFKSPSYMKRHRRHIHRDLLEAVSHD